MPFLQELPFLGGWTKYLGPLGTTLLVLIFGFAFISPLHEKVLRAVFSYSTMK